MAYRKDSDAVYEVARAFRKRCLVEGTSLLWPERKVWNQDNISAMWEAFVENPDEGERTFFEKWRDQFADQSEDVHRMAADLTAFYYLFPSRISFDKKMSNLKSLIGWKLSDDQPDLSLVEGAFRTGVGHSGMLYNTGIPWQMIFFLQFFRELLRNDLDPSDVEACRLLAKRVRGEVKSSNPAYNILLHLFFPDRFERVAADSHKRQIVEAFRDKGGSASDIDEALESIRSTLIEEYGREDLDFYDDDIWSLWGNSVAGGRLAQTSAEELATALGDMKPELHENYRKLLLEHYAASNYSITAKRLAELVGYANHTSINLHYGTLANKICSKLNIPSRGNGLLVTFGSGQGEGLVWIMRPEVAEALEELGWVGDAADLDTDWDKNKEGEVPQPNTILFGPPGTGKTYTVQRKAVEVIEPSAADLSDVEVSQRFRGYRDEGRIEFVTFHPSFSYEEFVEGFRYDPKTKVPALHDGVFKDICKRAVNPNQRREVKDGARIWKVSLGSADQPHVFERCMENGEIAIGWFGESLTEHDKNGVARLFKEEYGVERHTNSINSVDYFVNEMRVGDYVAVFENQREIRATGVVTGDYEFREDYDEYPHVRSVEWLDRETHDIQSMNGGFTMTRPTVYPLDRISLQDFIELLPNEERRNDKPYVLVIDEINRGNISRIFGELITLLETDKRRGAEHELSVTLPYSGENFSVPGNLHVIGTMNTADRSIALLDVALRRRFEFEEMMPRVDVVRDVLTEKEAKTNVDLICRVFETLNARITALLDRDHQLGHSYFLSATSPELLHHALYKRIFPLLQEYFYNDMEQLRQVLGEYSEVEGEKQGFVGESPLRGKLGADFETDHLWEFHVYEAHELEGVLKRTFPKG